jgi:hypothetical protein
LAHAAAYLEPNRGQMNTKAAFLARTPTGAIAAGPSEICFLRRDGSSAAIVFEGASSRAVPLPEHLLPGVSHYALDRDPSRWIWDVPRYGAVSYQEVYSGIDLVYRASRSDVEFDFQLAPGANPSRIRMRVPAGARVENSGALSVGSTLLRAPIAWQTIDGKRARVSARFLLDGKRRVSFDLGDYDRRLPLIIDPVVQFATFLGGSGEDIGVRVISGSDGSIYTAGDTTSADFPASFPSGGPANRPFALFSQTAYLSRLKADASAFDWSLFIGGSARQAVLDLKLDAFGNVYLLGDTTSPNFPVTPGAWHTTIDPSMTDLFLIRLDTQTGHIQTSTFLGIALYVNTLDSPVRLAIDPAGGLYIGGARLYSGNFSPTPGAFETAAPTQSFVLRLNYSMSAVVYATYWDIGSISVMLVDGSGNLLIGGIASGSVQGSNVPFRALNPYPGVSQSPIWPNQAYLARLNPTGTALLFASLLDGNGEDSAITDLQAAPDGSIWVAGWTDGTDFPQVDVLTPAPVSPGNSAPGGDFLVKLSSDAETILQSTPFYDPEFSVYTPSPRVALQSNGEPCVVGLGIAQTQQTAGGMLGSTQGSGFYNQNWSLSCVDSSGARIDVFSDLPSTGGVATFDVATTPDGAFLFTGNALNTFVTTAGVVQPNFGGTPVLSDYYDYYIGLPPGDAFLMRVSLSNLAPMIQQISPNTVVLSGATGTCTVNLYGSGFAYGATVTLAGQAVTYSFTDSADATISFDCGLLQPGTNQIAIALPPPGGGTSDAILTAINAPPSSISVTPTSVTQGAGETKVVISATNLSASSVLYWNGSPRAATFTLNGSNQPGGYFSLLLEPAELSAPMSAQITVSNPAPGGGTSPIAVFTVQPASGATVPVLNSPPVLLYGPSNALGPLVGFYGSGFTSGTLAFWDGASAPVTAATATSITIQPPASDLRHLGAHTLYVTNAGFQSPAVQVFVGLTISVARSAYDPARKLLYILTAPAYPSITSDLQVLDGTTGNVLITVPAIATDLTGAALSADGSYLYLAESPLSATGTILRYNASTGSVDLQWQVPTPNGNDGQGIYSIATPLDSPQTLIVSNSAGDVLIYDAGQPRLYDATTAGLPSFNGGYPLLLAGATQVYGNSGFTAPNNSASCVTSLTYDAFGISGGQTRCGGAPAGVQQDNGVTYLSDGSRFYVLSLPTAAPNSSFGNQPVLAADISSRLAWELISSGYSGPQLFKYNMNTEQLQLAAPFGQNYYFEAGGTLYPAGSGAVLIVFSSAVLLVP